MPWAVPSLLILSKYTSRLKNTSFVVGQYFKILKRYASIDMDGTCRA
jgi:hypothetical protein